MRALLALTLSLVALLCTLARFAGGPPPATRAVDAYFCEYPKVVTAAGHTVATPTICIPFP